MLGRVDFKAGDKDYVLLMNYAALYELESKHGIPHTDLASALSSVVKLTSVFEAGLEQARKRINGGEGEPYTTEKVMDILSQLTFQEAMGLADKALTMAIIGHAPEGDEAEEGNV